MTTWWDALVYALERLRHAGTGTGEAWVGGTPAAGYDAGGTTGLRHDIVQ